MDRISRSALIGAGTLVALTSGFDMPAVAQQAVPTAAAPAPANPSDAGVRDIVVTAQRRNERLQKSSLSIQVLSGESIQRIGVTTANDLNSAVPGLRIAQDGPYVQAFIRGVGDVTVNPLTSPAVAFNVDGVYIGNQMSIGTNFYDIARVEVLKGPQGTLYGRNASGGAINIITQAPVLGTTSGYLEVEGGNYSLLRTAGALNVPIGSTFAVRGAFQIVRHDGYLTDGGTDEKDQEGRLRALWKPSEAVSLLVNLDAAHLGGHGQGVVVLPLVDGNNPWVGINSDLGSAALSHSPGVDLFRGTPSLNLRTINVSAQLNVDFGPVTLTIIPAHRHVQSYYDQWAGLQYNEDNSFNETSLETRLGHNSNALKWVVGGYYYRDEQNTRAMAGVSTLFFDNNLDYSPKTRAAAVFGEATYSITNRLRIIGGARYTSDHKTISGDILNTTSLFGIPGTGRLAEVVQGNQRFKSTTWKAGAEYDLGPSNMLFATASTGFKAGGFNPTAAPNSFSPEKLTAYTIGSRNRFLGNRLQINLELYDWDYKNKQEGAIGFSPGGNLSFLIKNASAAKIKGAAVDVVARLTPHDTIQFNGEYTDAKYKSFIYQVPTATYNPAGTGCEGSQGGPGFTQLDCSGFPLPRAPKWTGQIGYDHVFAMPQDATLTANVDAQLSSGYWLATDFIPSEKVSGYATFAASLTFVPHSKAWTATAYVKNISNKAVYTGGYQIPGQNGTLTAGNINPPRLYGIRVRYNF